MLTEKFTYKKPERVEINGRRHYLLPDGSKVASVTTILDKTKSQESIDALAQWRKNVGYQRAQEITTEASGRGTRMHKYLEDFVRDDVLKPAGTNPYSQQSRRMAEVIINKGLCNVSEFWALEASLFYSGLYAGTTDLLGVWKGVPAIIDFKQTNKPKKKEWIDDYFVQTCAYAQAHNSMHGTDIKTGVILMCSAPATVQDDPVFQEFVIEGDEFEYYTHKWWDRVEKYYSQHA
jgi:hypothetical protein